MARWRLTTPHYLNVPDVTWEYKEVDRSTGRQKRVSFPVPQLLDPTQPSDWNYKLSADEGDIIVCHEGKGQDRDITFFGEPTPDMTPLDDEAKAISASLSKKWKHPINSLAGSFGDHLLAEFQSEVANAQSRPQATQVEGLSDLMAAMATVMKQNQELLSALIAKPAAAPPALKRA